LEEKEDEEEIEKGQDEARIDEKAGTERITEGGCGEPALYLQEGKKEGRKPIILYRFHLLEQYI